MYLIDTNIFLEVLLEQVGKAVTEFSNPIKTIDNMIGEIKKGNCQYIFESDGTC